MRKERLIFRHTALNVVHGTTNSTRSSSFQGMGWDSVSHSWSPAINMKLALSLSLVGFHFMGPRGAAISISADEALLQLQPS